MSKKITLDYEKEINEYIERVKKSTSTEEKSYFKNITVNVLVPEKIGSRIKWVKKDVEIAKMTETVIEKNDENIKRVIQSLKVETKVYQSKEQETLKDFRERMSKRSTITFKQIKVDEKTGRVGSKNTKITGQEYEEIESLRKNSLPIGSFVGSIKNIKRRISETSEQKKHRLSKNFKKNFLQSLNSIKNIEDPDFKKLNNLLKKIVKQIQPEKLEQILLYNDLEIKMIMSSNSELIRTNYEELIKLILESSEGKEIIKKMKDQEFVEKYISGEKAEKNRKKNITDQLGTGDVEIS